MAASQIQQIQFLHSTFEMNTSATCITRVTSTSLFLSRYVQTYVYVRVCQKHTHTHYCRYVLQAGRLQCHSNVCLFGQVFELLLSSGSWPTHSQVKSIKAMIHIPMILEFDVARMRLQWLQWFGAPKIFVGREFFTFTKRSTVSKKGK